MNIIEVIHQWLRHTLLQEILHPHRLSLANSMVIPWIPSVYHRVWHKHWLNADVSMMNGRESAELATLPISTK